MHPLGLEALRAADWTRQTRTESFLSTKWFHALDLRFEQSFSCRSPYPSIRPARLRVRWILVCYFRANHCSLSRMSTSECLHNLPRQCSDEIMLITNKGQLSEYRSRGDYRYTSRPCQLSAP